jgi:hypothetical protein
MFGTRRRIWPWPAPARFSASFSTAALFPDLKKNSGEPPRKIGPARCETPGTLLERSGTAGSATPGKEMNMAKNGKEAGARKPDEASTPPPLSRRKRMCVSS